MALESVTLGGTGSPFEAVEAPGAPAQGSDAAFAAVLAGAQPATRASDAAPRPGALPASAVGRALENGGAAGNTPAASTGNAAGPVARDRSSQDTSLPGGATAGDKNPPATGTDSNAAKPAGAPPASAEGHTRPAAKMQPNAAGSNVSQTASSKSGGSDSKPAQQAKALGETNTTGSDTTQEAKQDGNTDRKATRPAHDRGAAKESTTKNASAKSQPPGRTESFRLAPEGRSDTRPGASAQNARTADAQAQASGKQTAENQTLAKQASGKAATLTSGSPDASEAGRVASTAEASEARRANGEQKKPSAKPSGPEARANHHEAKSKQIEGRPGSNASGKHAGTNDGSSDGDRRHGPGERSALALPAQDASLGASLEEGTFTLEEPEPAMLSGTGGKSAAGERSARPRAAAPSRRALPGAAWARAAAQGPLRTETLAGGWKAMELSLGEGDGNVTIQARRDADGMAVSVGFSEPRLQAQATANARQLQDALQAQYESDVDLSFGGGEASGGETADDQPGSPHSTSPDLPADALGSAPDSAQEAAHEGGRRVWVG